MAALTNPICDFGWKARDFSLEGVDGKAWSLADVRGRNGTLVVFLCNHCPYVRAVIGRLVAESRALRDLGIGTIGIMPNDVRISPGDSFEAMKAFAREHDFPFPYVIDETQEVARAYPTRMAAIRLCDGDMFLWSPIALTPALARAVDALGPVRYLVSPNKLHHLFLGDWKRAYPDAKLCASPGLARRRKDLAFDAELGDAPAPEWAADIDQVMMLGSFALTEAVFFHRASATALFADLIQNFRPDWFKGWRGVLARLDGLVAPHPGAPREWRASFVNRRKARAALARVLAWPIERVVIAHGDMVTSGGGAFVRGALRWLDKSVAPVARAVPRAA